MLNLSTLFKAPISFFKTSHKKHFITYMIGIILSVKFHSVNFFSKNFSDTHQSSLNHFITDSKWKVSDYINFFHTLLPDEILKTQTLFLAIDDTCIKRKGKKIDGIGKHHTANGNASGQCLVTSMLTNGIKSFFHNMKGYKPKNKCKKNEFKTKIELANDIINNTAFENKYVYIMFDSWYSCKSVFTTIENKGYYYLSRLKQNRNIILPGKSGKLKVRALAKTPGKYTKVTAGSNIFRVRKIPVILPEIGKTSLFIVKHSQKGFFYLVSNDCDLSCSKAVKYYAHRFKIETMYRDCKQYLGLEEIFMRKWEGMLKHSVMSFTAWNILKNLQIEGVKNTLYEKIKFIQKSNSDLFKNYNKKGNYKLSCIYADLLKAG